MIGAGMNDVNVGPGAFATRLANRGEQLFVNSAAEPQVGTIADELDVVDDRDVVQAVVAGSGAMHLHNIAEHILSVWAVGQVTELLAAFGRNRIIGIHPINPFAMAMF